MSGAPSAGGVRLRRARREDLDFLVSLATDAEVAPYLAAVSTRDPQGFLAEIEAAEAAPAERGRFVVEELTAAGAVRAGSIAFEVVNRRSRIARLHGLMLRPDVRGRGLARAATRRFVRDLLVELGYHRVELECYGFNERAIRHAEACGFVREGVKRKAYRRGDGWVDGVLFALVREDLDGPDAARRFAESC